MHNDRSLVNYAEEIGGVFSQGDIEAIPFNHWKLDCEWLVLVIDNPYGAFVSVEALTAKEACTQAIYKYNNLRDDNE